MKKLILTVLVLAAVIVTTHAQDVKPILLYPDGVPNSKPAPADYAETDNKDWTFKVVAPTLLPYPADKSIATGTAVIICPGGGYGGLSMDNEGYSLAKAFNQIGVSAFI